jgi:hypothetical protein
MVDEQKTGRQHGRSHRKLWIALLVVVTILAGLAIYIVRFITAEPTISHDYTADYNALTRPANYDPNQNAAPLYEKAFAGLKEPPAGWPSPASFRPQQDPNGTQRRLIEPWVTSNVPALELIAQAVEKPYYWVESTSYPEDVFRQERSCRSAALCFCYRAKLQAADGDMGAALRSITVAHKIIRQLRAGGTQVHVVMAAGIDSSVCSTALALLADGPVSTDALSAFQRDFVPTQPSDLTALAGLMSRVERIRLLNNVQMCFTDNGKGEGHIVFKRLFEDARKTRKLQTQMDEAALYFKQLWSAWRHPGRRETIQCMDTLAKLMEQASTQTPWQLHKKDPNIEATIEQQVRGYYFLPGAGIFRLLQLNWRSYTSEAALVTTVAILRYKQDKETWPDSLEQLAKDGYIREVPMDPYGDGPLIYRPAGTTFILYSRGLNFDDDGGTSDLKDEIFWPVPRDEGKSRTINRVLR